jgi:hypothetical protein
MEDIRTPFVLIAGDTADNINRIGNSWTATRTMDSSDVEGLVTYNFTPQDLAGNPSGSSTQTTNGSRVIYDNTVPYMNYINEGDFAEDKDYTSIADTVRLGIDGGDYLSGVLWYEFCLGSSPGLANIISWRSTDGNVDTLAADITLSAQTLQPTGMPPQNPQYFPYYASAYAFDRAGNVSDTIFGDGFIVDITAPDTTGKYIIDGFNSIDVDWTIDSTRLEVSWDRFDDKPGLLLYPSDPIPLLVESYELSILDEPDTVKVVDWFTVDTLADSAIITGLTLQKNMKYFAAIRAVDMAGNKSDSLRTDGIWFDNQPARIDTITP